MFIQIDDKYALSSDRNSWMIQKKRKPTLTSPAEWESFLFHQTFKSAIESLTRRKIRLSGAQNLEAAIKDAQKGGEELSAIFDKNFDK